MSYFSKSENAILEEYYFSDPSWGKDTIKAASEHLNLPDVIICKWAMKNKNRLMKKKLNKFGCNKSNFSVQVNLDDSITVDH